MFFKRKNQKRVNCVNQTEQLDNIKSFAKMIIADTFDGTDYDEFEIHPIFTFIKMITDKIMTDRAFEITAEHKDIEPNHIFMNSYYEMRGTIDKEVEINLNICPVLPKIWCYERLKDNLSGKKRGIANKEIDFELWLPMGVTFCCGYGSHNIFAKLLRNEKSEVSSRKTGIVYDFSEMYKSIYFDGDFYREIGTDDIVEKSPCFEFGCIYEIGRIIQNSEIKFKNEIGDDKNA